MKCQRKGCLNEIAEWRTANAKYCSKACQYSEVKRRQREERAKTNRNGLCFTTPKKQFPNETV